VGKPGVATEEKEVGIAWDHDGGGVGGGVLGGRRRGGRGGGAVREERMEGSDGVVMSFSHEGKNFSYAPPVYHVAQ